MKPARLILRWLAAILFIVAGVSHFVNAAFYVRIVPPGLPWPRTLVWVSGACEILGGAGLLVPRARVFAGYGLIVLLVAVFPANIYMAQHPERFGIAAWILWARLPFQLVLAAWVWFVAIKKEQRP